MRYVLAFAVLYTIFILMWKRFWDEVGDPPSPIPRRKEKPDDEAT